MTEEQAIERIATAIWEADDCEMRRAQAAVLAKAALEEMKAIAREETDKHCERISAHWVEYL